MFLNALSPGSAAKRATIRSESTRFADGVVYDLRIPEPDYRIVVQVDDFREKTLSQTAGFRQQLYGAFFHVTADEPLSGTVYFDQSLRQGTTKAIPASQDVVDSASAYYETLLAGFSSFANAAQGGASAWPGTCISSRTT